MKRKTSFSNSTQAISTSIPVQLWHQDQSHFVLYTEHQDLAKHLERLTGCDLNGTYYRKEWIADQFLILKRKKKQILTVIKRFGYEYEWVTE